MPSVSTTNPDAGALLVQLSDSHLFAEADSALLGMNTRESLQRVIELVREQQPQVDLLLATGDLSQDGTLGVLPAVSRDDPVNRRPGAVDPG